MKYLSRVADKMLRERLETFGAVLGKSSVSCPLKPSDSAPLC